MAAINTARHDVLRGRGAMSCYDSDIDPGAAQGQMGPNDKSSSPTARRGKWPRANALRFYREKRDFTLQEVAKVLKTNHQTIQKLETGAMKLTPEWAEKIGGVLHVPAKFLAFSAEENAYGWAVKAVPVIGLVNTDMQIEPSETPLRHIGIPDAGSGLRAFEMGSDTLPGFKGWSVLADLDVRERVSQTILDRQAQNTQFVVQVRNDHGSALWMRKIVPSARRNVYHLESLHRPTVYDVEIEWVSPIRGFEPPGNDLPPFIR